MSAIAAVRAARRKERKALPWGSPAVYFVALIVIALMLVPIAYIIIGGFRTNSQITVDPAGFPNPWNAQMRRVGASSGRVILHWICQYDAPSRAAAS